MSPVIFTIFGFEVRWYSVLILLSVIISYFLIIIETRKFKIKSEYVTNLLFWTIIFGILGARIYYVLFNLDYYLANPKEIVMVWHGGLAIHGGIIAGLITIIFYTRRYNVKTLKILDIMAPVLIISQAIGRWGNFFNSEAYGSIVEYNTLVNMKIIPQYIIDHMYIDGAYRLPMFYFESLACLIGFLIILFIRRRKYIKNGQVFSFYLIWYGIVRFIIEIFRSDSLMLFNIKVAQIVSVLMVLAGIVIIIKQRRKPLLDELYNKQYEDIQF